MTPGWTQAPAPPPPAPLSDDAIARAIRALEQARGLERGGQAGEAGVRINPGDGRQLVIQPDGRQIVIEPDGRAIVIGPDGRQVVLEPPGAPGVVASMELPPPIPEPSLPPPALVTVVLAALAVAGLVLWPLARALARRIDGAGGAAELAAEVAALREAVDRLETREQRVAELEERVEFAERLLSRAPAAPTAADRP